MTSPGADQPTLPPFDWNPPSPLSDRLSQFAKEAARQAFARENRWMEACIRRHCPGIASLVDSRQNKLAARFCRQVGLFKKVYLSGHVELWLGPRLIGRLMPFNLLNKTQ